MNRNMIILSVVVAIVGILAIFRLTIGKTNNAIYVDKVLNVITSAEVGNYENAQRDFADITRRNHPVVTWSKMWTTNLAGYGRFKSYEVKEVKHLGTGTHVLIMTCEWEHGKKWVAANFNDRNQIFRLSVTKNYAGYGE